MGDLGQAVRHALRPVLRLTPRRADYAGLPRSWPRDLAAGVTVGVVALPLALGFGVDSGVGAAPGLALMHLARTARAVPEPLTDEGIDSATEHALLTGQLLAYRLDGPLFFAVADRFLREITATADVRVVILRLGSVAMLDVTGARVLGEIVEHLHRQGITVLVKGASDEQRRLLAAVAALAPLVERGHVFVTFPETVAHATRHAVVDKPSTDPSSARPIERVSCDRR